jgi:hypothetical protein
MFFRPDETPHRTKVTNITMLLRNRLDSDMDTVMEQTWSKGLDTLLGHYELAQNRH